MTNKLYLWATLLVSLLFFGSCSQQPTESTQPLAKHVVLIGLDGFGSYAYDKADMPNLKALAAEGTWAVGVRSVLPSSSAVNWASILMSSTPTQHGYTEWGSQTPEIPSVITSQYGKYPSIYTLIKEQQPEAKTAVIYSWGGIIHLLEKEIINFDIPTGGNDDLAAEKAAEVIKAEKPMFTFIHIDQPDGAGHKMGHDSEGYYEELKNVDKRVGTIVQAVEEAGIADETIIMVIADHGGFETGHGGKHLMEVETPLVVKGPGIKVNHEVKDAIMGYDYATTIAKMLGITPHNVWRGHVIDDLFI